MKLDIVGRSNLGKMKLDIVGGATGGNMKLDWLYNLYINPKAIKY
jgi:hypothetical protein